MKNIKAIFIDLDGTLIGYDGIVSHEAKLKLKELMQRGIKVFIATGRNLHQSMIITKDIENLGYITNNGAFIVNNMQEILLKKPLNREFLLSFVEDVLKFRKLNFFIQNQDKIMTNSTKLSRLSLIFHKNIVKNLNFKKIRAIMNKESNMGHIMRTLKNPIDFFETTEETWLKILVLGNEKGIKFLAEKYKKEASISFSGHGNIEVNGKGVSKGEAIKEVCKIYGISLKDTLCFGDSGNDVEMFKTCGVPVVMGNSIVEELHRLSKYKTKSHEENGVYEFLKEHF